MKSGITKSKYSRQKNEEKMQLTIFCMEGTELLINIGKAFIAIRNHDAILQLYITYIEWNIKITNFILKSTCAEHFDDWFSIKDFQPKKYSEIKLPITKKSAEIRDKIHNDLEELKSIVGEKTAILKKIKKELYREDASFEIKEGEINNLKNNQPSREIIKLNFDSLNGVLRYGDTLHKFHLGSRGEKNRPELIRLLWSKKRYIKNGKEKYKGKLLPPATLAIQLNITSDNKTFAKNEKAKNKFFALIKGINRMLTDKKMPAKIERRGGIQIVVIE